MHKYWARKPHNVVSAYIEKYSQPEEIVLDLFAGSGVTAIESLILKRKAIACDLDSVACFITRCTAMPVEITTLQESFDEIKTKVIKVVDKLYATTCSNCGRVTTIEATIWNKNEPQEIRYQCNCEKGSLWKNPNKADIAKIAYVENLNIPYWYPKNELIWNSRVNVHKGMKVSDLFTRRNLYVLALIYHTIDSLKSRKIREQMKFCFTASLGQASKLVFVIRNRGRDSVEGEVEETKEVGGWATRGFWIPPEYFEINAWNCFEERFNKLVRGKVETNELVGTKITEATKFEELSKEKPLLILNQSSTDLSNIPANSVDYIFTDPPYGDAIPYLELDLMWASWLKQSSNLEDEIIISDSKIRNKDFDDYYRLLALAFREAYRLLKPSKWLTVTFHSTDIKIYNSLIRAVVFAGFTLEKILYQYPARPSAKALLAPYGSAMGDYYIRFNKPTKPRQASLDESMIDLGAFENVVVESVKEIIAERGEPVTYNDILKNIYTELDKHGFLLAADPDKIQDIVNRHKDQEFEFIEGRGWYLKNPSEYFLHIVPLNERVEKTIVQILRRKAKVAFDEVLQELFLRYKNALTPSPRTVTSILEEYADKTRGGKWKLKSSVKVREDEHTKMIYILCRLGARLGFSFYSGHSGASYDGTIIADLPKYASVQSLSNIKPENISKINEIDVIWHRNGVIHSIFEVENTTGITDALVRGANILYTTRRYIVIPEERDKLLQSRMREPMLAKQFTDGHWKVIYYGTLSEFSEEYKRKSFSLTNFESIVNTKSTYQTLTSSGQLRLME